MSCSRIALIIYSLGPGGAERVASLLAEHWADQGREVTILLMTGPEAPRAYPLSPRVRVLPLALASDSGSVTSALTNNVRRVRGLRRALTDLGPGLVVSFMPTTNVMAVLACRGRVPLILTEHENPYRSALPRAWRGLRRLTYPHSRRLVSVSAGVDSGFRWLAPGKRRVIYNPIAPLFERAPADAGRAGAVRIVAMGRLSPEKGFDLLIEAFARIGATRPDWGLTILGEGGERGRLTEQIARLGLGERVRLAGQVADPVPFLDQASVFVLSSRHEGFGNVLVEAMARGLAVVSFDCDFGPAEIVTDEENGLLVPSGDVAALGEAIERLADRALRERLGSAARARARDFSAEVIFRAWDALVEEVA